MNSPNSTFIKKKWALHQHSHEERFHFILWLQWYSFCPSALYLASHRECQRCTGDSGAVGDRSQHQAGLSQELAGEGLQDRGPRLRGFGDCSGGRQVGGWSGVKLRSYNGEGLRGDCAVEHLLSGFLYLSQEENAFYTYSVYVFFSPHSIHYPKYIFILRLGRSIRTARWLFVHLKYNTKGGIFFILLAQ